MPAVFDSLEYSLGIILPDVVVEAVSVFGTKTSYESGAVNLLVEFHHTAWHDEKFIGIGR